MADFDPVAEAEKLNAGGERGRAIAVAISAKLTPDKVPFISEYSEHLVLNGLSFEPPVAEQKKAPAK